MIMYTMLTIRWEPSAHIYNVWLGTLNPPSPYIENIQLLVASQLPFCVIADSYSWRQDSLTSPTKLISPWLSLHLGVKLAWETYR